MPSIFNTDNINIMTILKGVVQYLIIFLIFISLGSKLIQTRTYVHISMRGTFDVSDKMAIETSEVNLPYSGVVYVSTIGDSEESSYDVLGDEDNWVEIVHPNSDIRFEEMEEGPYWFKDTDEFPFFETSDANKAISEDDDDFPNDYEYDTGMDGTNVDGFTFTSSWKDALTDLSNNGSALVPFIPYINNRSKDQIKISIRGNADKDNSGVARYKKDWDRSDRYGIGAFIVAIPAKGHYIKSVKVANFSEDCQTNSCPSTAYFTYKSPVELPFCSSSSCILDFENQFLTSSGSSNWFTRGYNVSASEDTINDEICFELTDDQASDTNNCYSRGDVPNDGNIQIGDPNDLVTETHVILKAWPISEGAFFNSYDYHISRIDKGYHHFDSNIWNQLWGSLFGLNTTSGMRLEDVLKGTGSADNILHRDYYTPQVSTQSVYQFTSTNYEMSDALFRRELPFGVGVTFVYNGGDIVDLLNMWFAEEDIYAIVNNHQSLSLQVHVEFAEQGYLINAEVYDRHLDETDKSTSALSSVISFSATSPSETPPWGVGDLNPDADNIATAEEIALVLGGSSTQCIQDIAITQERIEPSETGLTQNIITIENDNAVGYPLALGESILIGYGADSSFLLSDGTPEDLVHDLHAMSYNYDIVFNVFDPAFLFEYEELYEAGVAGIIGINRYIRQNDWVSLANSGALTLSNIESDLRSQSLKGSNYNDTYSCGFEGYFQELTIAPIQTDTSFYYFDSFVTFNSDVYVYNVHDSDSEPNDLVLYDSTTSTNVKYALNSFTAFAQVHSSKDAKVTALFDKFPTVKFFSFIDSTTKVVQNVTPNRTTTLVDEIEPGDAEKNLFFVDQTTVYNIEPNIQKWLYPTDATIFNSLEIEISNRLKRLYIEYDDNPIVIFSMDPTTDNENTADKIILDGTYTSKNLPNGDTVTSDTTVLLAELSGNSVNGYNLVLPFINNNTALYIDFVPFLIKPRQTLSSFDDIFSLANSNSSAFYVDGVEGSISETVTTVPTDIVNTSVKISNSVSDEIMGSNTSSTGNAVSFDITMLDSRETYYISDIVEIQIEEDNSVILDTTDLINPKSKISDIYNKLLSNLFNYLLSYNSTEFTTSSISKDLGLYIVLNEFSHVNYRLKNLDGTSTDNGQLTLDYSGFIARGPVSNSTDPTTTLNWNSDWTEIMGNAVYDTSTSTANVGFREWDDLNLVIEPDGGFTISTIKVYSDTNTTAPDDSVFESNSVEINKDTLFSPIGGLTTIKELDINNVTQNLWIEVTFREQSRKGFLGY